MSKKEKAHENEKNKNKSAHVEDSPKNEKGTDSQDVMLSRKDYEELQKRLEELEQIRDKMCRTAADFENAKKRLTRERDEFVKFAQESLIREILPVLDNFDRALSHSEESEDPAVKNLATGIQMVFKQLVDVLKAQGLNRLESVGKKFDPHLHESLGFVQEEGPEDEVVEEIQSGYMLRDRLLRAAKVRVRMSAQRSGSPKASEEKEEEIT